MMLQNWNDGLAVLKPAIQHPDKTTALVPYGTVWGPEDRKPIPELDIPAGLPPWMHENDGWAQRKGDTDLLKRRIIIVKVPEGVIP